MEYVSVLIDHQDELFRNNKSELEYAQDAKLGTALFESCLISNTPEDEIAKHAREVVFREIISTPTVIVGKDRLTNTRARFQGVELSVDHYLSTCSQDTVLIYPEFMEVKCGEKIPTQGVFNVVNEKGSFAEFEVKRAENISSLIEYLFIDAKGIERRPTARDGRLFDIRGADNSGDFVFRANLVDEEVVTTQICE
jgi:hypothetical protein